MSAGLKVKSHDPDRLIAIVVPTAPELEKPEKFVSLTGLLQSTLTHLETFSSASPEELDKKVSDLNYPSFMALIKTFRSFQDSLSQFARTSDSETRRELDKFKPTVQALSSNIDTLQHYFAPITSIFKDSKSLDRMTGDLISSMHTSTSMTALRTKLLDIEPVKARLGNSLQSTEMSSSEDIKKRLQKLQRFEDLLSFTQNTPSGTLCLFYKALQVYDPTIHSKIEKIFYQLHERDRAAILNGLQSDSFPEELTSSQVTRLYKEVIGKTLLEMRRDQLLSNHGVTLSQLKATPQLVSQYDEIAAFNQMVVSSATISPSSWDRLYGLFHCTEYPATCFDFFERKEIGHAGNEILINMFTSALQDQQLRSRSNVNLLLKLMNSQLLDPIRAGDVSNQESLRVEVLCRAEYLYALNSIQKQIEKYAPTDVHDNIKPILKSLIQYLTSHPWIMNEEMHLKIRFFIEILSDLQSGSFTNFHDTERRIIHYAYLGLFRGTLPSGQGSLSSSMPSLPLPSLPVLHSSSLSLGSVSAPSMPTVGSSSGFVPIPQSQFRFQGDFERLRLKFEVLQALGGPVLHPSKQSNNLSCMKLLNEMRDQLKQQQYNRETFASKFLLLPEPIQKAIQIYFANYCSVSGSDEDRIRYAEENQFNEAYFLQMRKSFNLFMQSSEMLEVLKTLDSSDLSSHTKQVTVKFAEIQSVNLVDKNAYLDDMNAHQHNVNFQFQMLFKFIVGAFDSADRDQAILTPMNFYQSVPLDLSSNCFPPEMRAEDVKLSWDWDANFIKQNFSPIFMKIFSNNLILQAVSEKIESSNLPLDAKTAAYLRIEKIRKTFQDCIHHSKSINPSELLEKLVSA